MSPHSKRQIGTVILAAGDSSRLGQPKQLLRISGKSLVRRIIDAAGEAGCSPITVVTGGDHDEIVRELEETRVIVVQNKNWQHGIGTSIRAGVKKLVDNVQDLQAVVLLVCDQPFVTARTIEGLITLREKMNKSIVASRYADTLGVPALFDRSFFQELLSLSDEAGAKSIILRNRERVAQFRFPEGNLDIDTLHDYEKLTERKPNDPVRRGGRDARATSPSAEKSAE